MPGYPPSYTTSGRGVTHEIGGGDYLGGHGVYSLGDLGRKILRGGVCHIDDMWGKVAVVTDGEGITLELG